MDAIYLAIGGESKGPFTLAQVRELLAKGEITRDTPAWYAGLAEWITLGPILDAVGGAPPPAVPPPVAPAFAATAGEFTKDELRHICKSQNLLMYAVLAGFSAYFLVHIPVVGLLLVLTIAAFEIYTVYQLGTALRIGTVLVVVLCLCMFIPCISLILLVLMSGRASKILKANGVRVGIMGGNIDDIRD
jgi:hypothetical protein